MIQIYTKIYIVIILLSLISCSDLPINKRSVASSNKEYYGNFVHYQNIHLKDFDGEKKFYLNNTETNSHLEISNDTDLGFVDISISCDQEFQTGSRNYSNKIEGRSFKGERFSNFNTILKTKSSITFLMNKDVKNCLLEYKSIDHPEKTSQYRIENEEMVFPWLKKIIGDQDSCNYINSSEKDSTDNFFYKISNPQLSCAHEINNYETLDTPESGFIAKTEMLLGKKLDHAFISNQNPFAELDFSHAPKLNAIFLATLVYRSDFYGNVMARLLKYHADRGTMVYLVTTEYMMLDKDKKLLHSLASSNGNIRLQEFRYYDTGFFLTKPFRFVDTKYRDMHIKLLITLSDDEDKNAVVFGGRNIHDGFLFKDKPDYGKYPTLVQYGKEDDFVHWNDFEMKITSSKLAKKTAAHLLKFLNRDSLTQDMLNMNDQGTQNELDESSHNLFRHFISLPYKDDNALEKLYVSLIDSATKSILISSPYLRPTDKILHALERAAQRKIDITIQTRVELIGDTDAWLYEEVNKESINKLYQQMKIYQWKENSILHSKFILVDGKTSFIGSVNLSRRSFIQDVENGFLINSEEVNKKMENIFYSYLAKSKQITEAEKRKFFPTLIIQILKNQF